MNLSRILRELGAVVYGHFVGTSGRHMSIYINKDRLISFTKYTSKIGKLFAEKSEKLNIEVVVAPAIAGIALSQWTVYYLSKLYKSEVLTVYTEKTLNNEQVLKRGYDLLVRGKRVLIVEDVATSGSSIKKVIRSVKKAGGDPISACVIVNRDPKFVNTKNIGIPLIYLVKIKVESYNKNSCPMCKSNIPIDTSLGHGNKI